MEDMGAGPPFCRWLFSVTVAKSPPLPEPPSVSSSESPLGTGLCLCSRLCPVFRWGWDMTSVSLSSLKQVLSGPSKTSDDKAGAGLTGAGLTLTHSFLSDVKAPRKASSYRETSRTRGPLIRQHCPMLFSSELLA